MQMFIQACPIACLACNFHFEGQGMSAVRDPDIHRNERVGNLTQFVSSPNGATEALQTC